MDQALRLAHARLPRASRFARPRSPPQDRCRLAGGCRTSRLAHVRELRGNARGVLSVAASLESDVEIFRTVLDLEVVRRPHWAAHALAEEAACGAATDLMPDPRPQIPRVQHQPHAVD